VEESDPLSDSESDSSPSEELESCATFFVAEPSSSELEFVSEEDDSLPDELVITSITFTSVASSLEDGSESEDDSEDSLEDGELALVFIFLAFGASSSELGSDPEVEDSLLDETALRFRPLAFGFSDGAFAAGVSFSSSASLSELLEEAEDEEGEDDVFAETFLGGASVISTSLPSLLLDSWAFAFFFSAFCFLVTLPFSPRVAFESGTLFCAFNTSHSL
jgi:hypothetical protein